MRKLLLGVLLIASAGNAQSDIVKLSGKVTNRNSDTIFIHGPQKFKKAIALDKKGAFSETFAVTPGPFQLSDGVEQTFLYLRNGYDLTISLDAKRFDETLSYKGIGELENNFLAQKALSDEKIQEQMETATDEETFSKVLAARQKTFEDKLADPSMDANFKNLAGRMLKGEAPQMVAQFKQSAMSKKMLGAPSPTFDYENFKGGKTKLEDLRGKYVYIDVWATWCGPSNCLKTFLLLINL